VHEIFEYWDLDRVDDANCVLDAIDLAHVRAVKATQKKHTGMR
jgi:hypothetical protein